MCFNYLLPVETLLATWAGLVSLRQANYDEGRRARLLFAEIFRHCGVASYLMSVRPLLNKTRPPTSPVTMCQVWWRQHLHRQPLTAYFALPSHSNTAGSDSGKGSRVNLSSSEHLISGLPQNVQSPPKLTRQCSQACNWTQALFSFRESVSQKQTALSRSWCGARRALVPSWLYPAAAAARWALSHCTLWESNWIMGWD